MTFSNAVSLIENLKKSIKISLICVSKDPIKNILALVQIMGRYQPGTKPLFEPMMVIFYAYVASMG